VSAANDNQDFRAELPNNWWRVTVFVLMFLIALLVAATRVAFSMEVAGTAAIVDGDTLAIELLVITYLVTYSSILSI
jgi:hypothetical protein